MPHSSAFATPLPPAAIPTPDAVQALRHATADLHRQLDQGLPLARADATLADYALHLTVLGDWQQALSPWLTRVMSAPLPLDLIALDLKDCTAELGPSPAAALAPPDVSPVHAVDDGSDAFCRGMAYVLDGSRLGGQVLHRQLKDRLAPHPMRYLRDRPGDGQPWPRTLASLREHLPDAASQAAACRGAVVAFEALLARFRQAGSLA